MMGIGKPVVFTVARRSRAFRKTRACAWTPGAAEEEMLAETIVWLAGDPEAAAEIGKRAAHHITEAHSLGKIAARYWEILNQFQACRPARIL